MADSHNQFLLLLERGLVATGVALRELAASDSDDMEELLAQHGDSWTWASAVEYDIERLRADVAADRDLLLGWAADASSMVAADDPKLKALSDELANILAEAAADVGETSTEADRRKVIIFSYYADTVSWLDDWLRYAVVNDPRLAPYRDRVVAVSGSDRDTDQQKAMFGFAPITAEAPPGHHDAYDVLVSTDVLAEGVNLQQARNIINYDLPWNPMRLVQRHGRIDRIGSPHTRVWMRCFMPDRQLDTLLKLEERLHRKIKQAARSIGTESTIIPGSEVSDRSYTDTREAIEEIRRGETGFLDETQAGMSVEEYRQQLREGLENPFLADQIKGLAWGSGSGKTVDGADPGVVFCARVGDNPEPQFRYVNMADPAAPVVVPDVLACLKHAYATVRTERVLTDDAHKMAYQAWAYAKASIYETWLWATDPRNLQPEVPKVMRDAAELVRTNPPLGMDQAAMDRLYDTLNAPYAERVRKQIRAALAGSIDPQEKVTALVDVVNRLALTPPPNPTPLPIIDDSDINLICWLTISPAPPDSGHA